ncbi:MAG: glycosyltransferase family 4 protein [bacterium]|nr:glycosyltransferase family 4 protein [bacterium]
MTHGRVLHVLAQRPGLTGSGVTLDALVRNAGLAGWEQAAVVGIPAEDTEVHVGDLEEARIHPLRFDVEPLPFPVPGMSDVMPYPSTRYSEMSPEQLSAYCSAWRKHLGKVMAAFKPEVIHSHHVWLVTGLLRDIAPSTPIVAHCHATGLRQMELTPHLAKDVRRGCARADRFVVLHREHAEQLGNSLGVTEARIHVVGAGFREDLFHSRGRSSTGSKKRLLFVGKLSAAKGLPWLLEAFEQLVARSPELELHVAGSGAGDETEALKQKMDHMAPNVVMHGQLNQSQLAGLMRRCSVFVLPSLYEGLPLVLVEARACGCHLVATALPGVVESLALHLGDALELVSPPLMHSVDVPDERGLPNFVEHLTSALEKSLYRTQADDHESRSNESLAPFTWGAVFRRVEAVWRDVSALSPSSSTNLGKHVRC